VYASEASTTSVASALGRWSAILGTVSAVSHLGFLMLHGAGHPPVVTTLMTVMATACLVCAWHLWRHPSRTVWIASAAMYGGMCLLHLPLAVQGSGNHAMHGGHTAGTHEIPIALMSTFAIAQVFLAITAVVRTR
jgi:hypothetical protein